MDARKRRAAVAAGTLLALAVPAVILAAVPSTFKAGDVISASQMNANFTALDQRLTTLEGSPAAPARVVAQSAKRTGSVAPNTSVFTTIPGLTVTLNLDKTSLVQMSGNGTQRMTTTTAGSTCHVAYRYLIDGTGKGDPDWGQRIHVSEGATSWHSTWSLVDGQTLGPGAHTIAVQARMPSPTGSCYVCGEWDGAPDPHDDCNLNVIAIPQ